MKTKSHYIKKTTIGETWLEYMNLILTEGIVSYDSKEDITEIIFSQIEIDMPSSVDSIIEKYGEKNIIDIYRKKMFSKEIIPELNSTYGDRLFDAKGFNQIENAIEQLKNNKWAKSCFIPLVFPNDPGPRVPCLSAIQPAIRDGKLIMFATFRSQNAFNAYGNFLGLCDIQTHIASALAIQSGSIFISINFPHIYKSDILQATKIVAEAKLLGLYE